MAITEKQVLKEIDKFRALFDLERFEFKVTFTKENKDYFAQIAADPDYLTAVLEINLFRHKTIQEVRRTLLHEMFHLFHSPYTRVAKRLVDKRSRKILHDLEETLATRFERWEVFHRFTK